MAVEVTIIVRFEHSPAGGALEQLIEDMYDDAIVLEVEEEDV